MWLFNSIFSFLLPLSAIAQQGAPIVFFDIAGRDSAALSEFYSEVFGWDIGGDGSFSVTAMSPLDGLIRQDPSEKRIYLGVEDIAATLIQVEAKGGTVDAPRFEVPGVVVLGLFKDPAGNPMALVEMLHLEQSLNLAPQTAEALDAAHEMGVSQHDLKPVGPDLLGMGISLRADSRRKNQNCSRR